MNTQVERLASRRSPRVLGLAFLDKLAAWAALKYEAYRARRLAIDTQEAFRAMSPDLLDDIGVNIDKTGNPLVSAASQNPHVIAAEALIQPARYHDPF
jgi:hypothetical protein